MRTHKLNKIRRGIFALATFVWLSSALIFAQHAHHKQTGVDLKDIITNRRPGMTVEYDLTIGDTLVNYTGAKKKAMAINGKIPGPTLYFTEGDTAVIRVHNRMHMETSVHWHGLLLPNEQDGVPYLTNEPIQPHSTYTFQFPIIQSGTYWYHSHTMLQEQSGLYGSIVIHPRDWPAQKEHVILLSDWTNENPHQVWRSLKYHTDWYAIKKNAVQSWGEAIAAGYFKDKIKQEWSRMPAMDVSDVYYDTFLLNGQAVQNYDDAKAGERVRLRIINGSSSTYYWLQYADSKMTVVAADGIDVEPVDVDKILIAVAETYDVLITIPENGSNEFRATAEDITGYASAYFGSGEKNQVPGLAKLNYFAMMREMNQMHGGGHQRYETHAGTSDRTLQGPAATTDHHQETAQRPVDSKQEQAADSHHHMHMSNADSVKSAKSQMAEQHHATMPAHEMHANMRDANPNSSAETILNYDMLRASYRTKLDPRNPVREIPLTLTGNMRRYVWSFDNKTLSQADKILIKKGENVRFVLTNSTMMRHPLHLHGHFFRLVNTQGDYAPLKHTFDIQPMETVTIEFYANEEKDWFFHCHILYHMMSGMARVISYAGSTPNPVSITGYPKLQQEDNQIFTSAYWAAQSQGQWANLTLSNNNYLFDFDGRINWDRDFEVELRLQRFMDAEQYLALFFGSDITGRLGNNNDSVENHGLGYLGLSYLLPFFVESELRMDHKGKLRLGLGREDLALTRRLRLDWEVDTGKEYLVGMKYILTKYVSLSTSYHNEFGFGGGLTFQY